MKTKDIRFGAVILAGGRSQRMGVPKLFLKAGDCTILENLLAEYQEAGIHDICLVINRWFCVGEWEHYLYNRLPYIVRVDPGMGRFHSLRAGLRRMPDTEQVFLQNADNPFTSRTIIRQMAASFHPAGRTHVTFQGKKGHPVLISKKIVQRLIAIPGDDHNLRDILGGYPEHLVETADEGVLVNMNTPEDYARMLAGHA
ncbi:MAG: nucleotidyltransferase family protein [Bacteroidota bacterium]